MKTRSIVLLAALITLATRAEAGDTTFHGSACQPYSPDADNDMVYSTYGVENRGSLFRYVWCAAPATTESPDATAYGNVYGVDNSTAASVTCTLFGLGMDGSVYYSLGNNTTNAGKGNFNFNFHPAKNNGLYYAYFCGLPGLQSGGSPSRLNSFRFRN